MRRSLLIAVAALAATAPAAAAMPDGHGPPDRPERSDRLDKPERPDRPTPPERGPAAEDDAPDARDGGTTDTPARPAKPGSPAAQGDDGPEARGVRYALKGVVVRNAGKRAVRVKVVRANPHLRRALPEVQAPTDETDQARPVVLRVRIGSKTAIVSRSDVEGSEARVRARQKARSGSVKPRSAATYRALRKGDRVSVVWHAPAGLAAAKLPAATRIADHGPRKGRGPSGAAFTTNHDGTAVNVNRYVSVDDVYLNGGPSCGAQRHAAALPDGRYVFQVTTPNGRKLSTRHISKRSFVMRDSAVTSSTAPTNPLGCDIDGLVVQVGPFKASPNGVYKLWIAPVNKVKAGKFSARVSKTDNFMIDPRGTDLGDDPAPHPDPTPDPDSDPEPDPGPTF
ncbi:MAG: hypothetical protein ACR2N6_01000 [Miltoncostaeaceae bacterium]